MENEDSKVIKAYKGFDKDLKCRGFQYEVGKEYEIAGDVKCCKNGFHACENPLDVLDHYFLDDRAGICRFCEVEQSGQIDDNGSKNASSKIKINAELKFADFIKVGIEWIQEKTIKNNFFDKLKKSVQNDNGERKQKLSDNNYSAKIGSSGDSAQIGSSGDSAKIGSSGDYAKIGSSGYSAKIGSSGDSAKIGSSGYSAKIGSSGDYAQIGSSGDSAQIGSSGDSAKIGSSGDSAKIGSSGYSAQIGSSGDSAQIDSTGEDSVICCAGLGSKVKAKKGSWITLSEWQKDEKKDRWVPKCVKTEFVDGETIKEDTWYTLKDGEFVEVDQ